MLSKSVLFQVLLSALLSFLDMGLHLLVSAVTSEPFRGLEAHLDKLHDADTQPQAQGPSQLWS